MRMILTAALAALLLWAGRGPARAEACRLAEEPDLSIRIESAEPEGDGVRLTLICLNRTEREESLLFLVPKTDGKDTVFGSGWPSEETVLPPGEKFTAGLTVLPAEGQERFSRISLRLSYRGRLSAEAELFPENPEASVPAAFGETETQVIRGEARTAPGETPAPIPIRDRITAEETARLDYGRAWVCLRREETLIPFCQILLQVDEEGNAEGTYSGLAVRFGEDGAQPLEILEEHSGEETVFRTEDISMTGESVFFATLQAEIRGKPETGFRVTRQTMESSELGGKYDQAPLGLLDTAEPVLRVMEKTEAPVDTISVETETVSLAEPLTVTVFPASGMGEIWIYCEYFFLDGTDTVHAPKPI